MSANPFFSGRIPSELLERIKQRTVETGETKTDILIKALSAYLDFPIEARKTQNSDLWEAIAEIRERLSKLENQTDNIEITSNLTIPNLNAEVPQNEITNVIDADNKEIINSEIDVENVHAENESKSSGGNLDNSDNTFPISDNSDNGKADIETKQLSLLENYNEEYKDLENSNFKEKIIKTNEIATLPGLKNENAKKLGQKLRNDRKLGKIPVKVGPYLLDWVGKEPGDKGALLWKILEIHDYT